MMTRPLLIAAATLVLHTTPAVAQDTTHPQDMDLPAPSFERPDPEGLRLELDNGLRAYVAEDHRAPLMTLTAFVAAGSAHGEAGEAAAVAAALRRGPASMSVADFRAALDQMAAAYTVTLGREETEITMDVPAGDAWRALDLFSATLQGPALGASSAGSPARTSQAEGIDWASSIAGAIAAFDSRLYQGHPFGRSPSADDVDEANAGGAERYHRTYFVPANVVLAVAGDFDAAEARHRTAEAFSRWSGGERAGALTFPNVTTESPRRVLQANADKLQGWVVIGHEIPIVPRQDQAALDVMNYILGAYHLDSRLYRESRELRGLTNDNSSFLEPGVRGPGSYTFRTYGRPEAVRLLVEITFRELQKIRDTRASDDELFVAKGALADGTYASQYATGLDASRSFALEWLRDRDHDWSAGYTERIRAVTLEQVQAAAQRYIHPDRMLVSVMGPLEKIEASPMIESEPQLDAWGEIERVDGGGR